MEKLFHCHAFVAGSRYYFTQVRFAGRYYRAMGKEDCPDREDQIR